MEEASIFNVLQHLFFHGFPSITNSKQRQQRFTLTILPQTKLTTINCSHYTTHKRSICHQACSNITFCGDPSLKSKDKERRKHDKVVKCQFYLQYSMDCAAHIRFSHSSTICMIVNILHESVSWQCTDLLQTNNSLSPLFAVFLWCSAWDGTLPSFISTDPFSSPKTVGRNKGTTIPFLPYPS